MKRSVIFILLIFSLLLFFLLDILLGSASIPLKELLTVFENDTIRTIVFDYRLLKALTAVLAGAALSVAGLLMQTLFRNPLAGPDVLGVTSGASLGVSLFVMASGAFVPSILFIPGWGQVIGAVLGATLILLLVLVVSFRVSGTVSLLIIGIMFGSIAGSLVSILQSVSNPDELKEYVLWTLGSLGDVSWSFMKVMAPVVLLGLVIALFLQKRLNAILLGEHYAQNLGVSIVQTRFFIIVATSLLAGGVTAFTGPIAFIGIAVPHLVRGFFQTSNHRTLLPGCMLCGASLMLICDLLSQLPGILHVLPSGYVLPINSITALFGAPIIIWIIFKKKQI